MLDARFVPLQLRPYNGAGDILSAILPVRPSVSGGHHVEPPTRSRQTPANVLLNINESDQTAALRAMFGQPQGEADDDDDDLDGLERAARLALHGTKGVPKAPRENEQLSPTAGRAWNASIQLNGKDNPEKGPCVEENIQTVPGTD